MFGQLGTIAFSMIELEFEACEVEASVLAMGKGAQLTEEMESDLLRSIRAAFKKRTNVSGKLSPLNG